MEANQLDGNGDRVVATLTAAEQRRVRLPPFEDIELDLGEMLYRVPDAGNDARALAAHGAAVEDAFGAAVQRADAAAEGVFGQQGAEVDFGAPDHSASCVVGSIRLCRTLTM